MQATFHSNRGVQSALVLIKDDFSFAQTPVYVPRKPTEGLTKGDTFEIPDTYQLVPFTGIDEDGNEVVRTTKDGTELKTLKRIS